MVSRTQALVLWFVLVAWLSLIVILVTAPELYDEALPALGDRRAVEIAFLMLLSAFPGLLAVGARPPRTVVSAGGAHGVPSRRSPGKPPLAFSSATRD